MLEEKDGCKSNRKGRSQADFEDVVENKELRVGLEVLGVALRLLVVDFYDSHLREAMKWGEEAAMVVGDKDDQGVDGDGGLRPGEDVEVVGSHGGFQGEE
uniref:Uncharacterized protein n=1 Tax=Vitis vinifera TaxID=29760 RepID=F6H9A0_VITVI